MTVRADSSPRRRRRTPEAAQKEIIEAAEGLLRERPFRELTVDEVMRRTELSRPSFYVYFRDRHELVLRVVQHQFQNFIAPANRWLESDEGGADDLRDAIRGVVAMYSQFGHVLRALADAAADDPEVEAAYNGLNDTFRDLAARKIEAELKAGTMPGPLNAHEVSTALIRMFERYLYLAFGQSSVDTELVTETISAVWTRTLYCTP